MITGFLSKSPHKGGTNISEQIKAGMSVTCHFTTNGSVNVQRWADSTLEDGKHRH
jgi:hypothetical protein